MEYRQYGGSGFVVSVLGFGAGHIGGNEVSNDEAGTILNRALDLGITLFDTARGYGLSEERIGRHLSWRRHDFILSTKVGYGIDNTPDWTAECIRKGVEQALVRMQTDYIDIVHLHSCPVGILEQGDVVGALLQARDEGKIRAVAYSGDNDPLEYAISTGLFDGVEMSINICDQHAVDRGLADAKRLSLGVIAKRPLANGPWRYPECPQGQYVEPYWHRFHAMQLDTIDTDWQRDALLFTASSSGVSSCIVGSRNTRHIEENVGIIENTTLPDERYALLRDSFRGNGKDWYGEV